MVSINHDNEKIKGIHKSRYVASWDNTLRRLGIASCFGDIKDWLRALEIEGETLTEDEIDAIVFFAENGKMELEHDAERFILQDKYYEKECVEDIEQSLEHIGELMPEVEKKNPGLTKAILDTLKWG